MIVREQIKAGRAMLDMNQSELAKASGVSIPTIKLIETGKTNPSPDILGRIQATFEKSGLEFMPQRAVRFRDDLVTVLEREHDKDDMYLRLLDDIYYTVRDTGGEILHSFVDDSLSPPHVIEREQMIRATGATMRSLVRNGDTYLPYPLEEYRYLPEGFYINNPTTVYGDKIALIAQDEPAHDGYNLHIHKILIIRNEIIANVKRLEFEILWKSGTMPEKSTAPERRT
jgi:transcriptional regulator with XRE-family HTH domain